MARDGRNCHFSFWAIFCHFTPLTAQKFKIYKNEKKTWRYHHFTHVYQKLWLYDVRTDGPMDGKWNIEVGAPPKKQEMKHKL